MFRSARLLALFALLACVATQIQALVADIPSFDIEADDNTNFTDLRRAASSFSFRQNDGFFTFDYSTTEPHSGNWIGVYKENGGPVNQVKVEQSLVWEYTPHSSGRVHIPAGSLAAGRYRAFFLAREEYGWLANPIYVTIPTFRSSFRQGGGSQLFTFQYESEDAQATNWIGIYPPNGGPVNDVKVAASLAWAYAPGASGTVTVSADSLEFGDYRAFYLQRDGYRRLTGAIGLTIPRFTGTISWVQTGDLFTFDYTTNGPSSTNWIGIYPAGGGPVNEEKVGQSLIWAYTPGRNGRVTISAGSLPGGTYRAFFLARDGYKWLASPINVRLSGVRFPVQQVTVRNARVGSGYNARVGGLALGDTASARFSKVSGAGWVSVSSDGTLTGTPSSSGESTVVVRANNGEATADLTVRIPVRGSGQCLVQDVRVMSYNMWHGGSRMDSHHEKQIRALITANVDVVGMQEANPDRARHLAEALGWYYAATPNGGGVSVLSRYPIASSQIPHNYAVATRVSLDSSRQEMHFWSAHLTAYPYGPYEACFERKSVAAILDSERNSGRTGQITAVVNSMAGHLAMRTSIPVVLTGDFNAPSHLDWIPALSSKNCGYSNIQWPTSRVPADAGLVDSFRTVYPNPLNGQGTTWSPIVPVNPDNGRPEPQDRIDYTFHAGNVQVLSSQTFGMGSPNAMPEHSKNEWTSDHLAVLTEYRINQGVC